MIVAEIDLNEVTPYELEEKVRSLSVDELDDILTTLNVDIGNIKFQIENAKASLYATGEYSDPKWFAAAKIAKRVKGNCYQVVCREKGRRAREDKANRVENHAARAERRKSFDRVFRDLARDVLTGAAYRELCDKAEEVVSIPLSPDDGGE